MQGWRRSMWKYNKSNDGEYWENNSEIRERRKGPH